MPVSYIDRFRVRKEDIEAAEQWTLRATRHLGYTYDKQISALTIYSSKEEDLWVGGEGEDMTPNPETVTLSFNFGNVWKEPYLRNIRFDVPASEAFNPAVEWTISETADDPPESLEELIEMPGNDPRFARRAQKFPAFFELYSGVMQRLFPEMEHAHLHSDVGGYDEAKTSPSHIKKEIWRTDIIARLQELRFPPMEIELAGSGHEGVIATWQPGGHTNYQIWFNLYVGEDPKVCVYCDPTQSGSTTGWLSTRLIKNEEALNKLPYTLEQWANEDLRKKRSPEYFRWQKSVRELLRHHLPRDLEEAWGAIRRQLIHIPHEEMHSDVGGYDESLLRHLKEREETPENWVKLTPVEILALKPGEEVSVNYHGRAYPAKWVSWFRSDLGGSGEHETFAKVKQPVAAELLSDPNWDPKETEAVHIYRIRNIGKDVPVEHEELHTDTGGSYEEAFLAHLPERFKLKG